MSHIPNDKGYRAAAEVEWLYPPLDPRPPLGVKLMLLTIGGVQVSGNWTDDGRFIAYADLLKRNKEKERQLGYRT